ncbi:MAG: hypothetical protein NTU64_15250 [Hyphomicrobiales bacterium]|nr:hypothetical protein [Hyphomicrobiales bacterium]
MSATDEICSARRRLYILCVSIGIATSILFILIGLSSDLQMFGDGSIFSYAVAAQDAWPFHWHNISGRLFTYVFAYIPAETAVALTEDARAGIFVYGLLFFSAPLFGLLATLAADRTPGRTIFGYACLSTACLCPLVFGAPTEMWMAHTLFWPVLAICLCAPSNFRGAAAVFAALLALVFTHEGAIVLSGGILLALLLHGWRGSIFTRAAAAILVALTIWLAVKMTVRPDDYIAGVLAAAAFKFIDIRNLLQPAVLLLLATLLGYGAAVAVLRQVYPARAYAYASFACATAIAVYWMALDKSLLGEARYDFRTVLLIATPILGVLAAVSGMPDAARRKSPIPYLSPIAITLERTSNARMISGAILLIMLVHVVETSKFVWMWTNYKAAVRALATGRDADPALGDPQFISSQRIGSSLNRLAWNSTTLYLSVLVAPGLKPDRLVVDPSAGYFWLSCATAKASEIASTAIPQESRRLVRIHACLHR